MRIFLSLSGEGRGHVVRSIVIIEKLISDNHEVFIFTGGDAYDFLIKNYPHLNTQYIPVLRFGRFRHRISYLKTIYQNFLYLLSFPFLLSEYTKLTKKFTPNLVISDFEPILARVAKYCSIPLLTVDHQQAIVHANMGLPFVLKLKTIFISFFIKMMTPKQNYIITTSFFKIKPKNKYTHMFQAGPLLRSQILKEKENKGNSVLVYIKEFNFSDNFLNILIELNKKNGTEFIIYGVNNKNRPGIIFKKISDKEFIKDLKQCKYVMCGAGNQLISESLYFNKPLFLFPEIGQTEQIINAHFLKEVLNFGDYAFIKNLNVSKILDFEKKILNYKMSERNKDWIMNGNKFVFSKIDKIINNIQELK